MGALLGQLAQFIGKYVSYGMGDNDFVKEVLRIGDDGGGSLLGHLDASLHASLELGVRIVVDVKALLGINEGSGSGTKPFSFYLTGLQAQVGGALVLRDNTPLFEFDPITLNGSLNAEITVSGGVPPGEYPFNMTDLWSRKELAGSYKAELKANLSK